MKTNKKHEDKRKEFDEQCEKLALKKLNKVKFEITTNKEAEASIDSIIIDLQKLPRIYYKVKNLQEIKTTIGELIIYYKNEH